MKEVLKLSKELEIHHKSYHKVRYKLKFLYKHYSNEKVIVDLFEYWILSLNLIYCSYGADGLKRYLRGGQKDPVVFSYEYEFKAETGLVSQATKINIKGLFRLLNFFPLNLRFPGSPNTCFFDRFLAKYTSLIARSIPTYADKNLEKNVVDVVNLYLSEVGIDVELSNDEYICIPSVFRSRQLKRGSSKILNVKCAPVELMHFNGSENIFLMKNKLEVIGFQHGGGYDNIDLDLALSFEKKISSVFYGWGLSENNTHQHRFARKSTRLAQRANKGRVIWVESPRDTKLIAYYYPLAYAIKKDTNVASYIFSELKESNVGYYSKPYSDELRSDKYIGKRDRVIDGNKKAEDVIRKGDLVIFDNCMHSLIYYCIENNIMFIIVSCKSLEIHYTDEMRKWYKVLRRNNLFFFPNEEKLLRSKICELSLNYTISKDMADYHYEKFINI